MNADQRRQAEEWEKLINGASMRPLGKTCACSLNVTEAKDIAALLRAGIAASDECERLRCAAWDAEARAGEATARLRDEREESAWTRKRRAELELENCNLCDSLALMDGRNAHLRALLERAAGLLREMSNASPARWTKTLDLLAEIEVAL